MGTNQATKTDETVGFGFYDRTVTMEARQIGKAGRVTVDALFAAITWLESYEYTVNAETEQPHGDDRQHANELMSVVAMLEREVQRRQAEQVENRVWQTAAAKGWDRNNPAHRKAIREHIKAAQEGCK